MNAIARTTDSNNMFARNMVLNFSIFELRFSILVFLLLISALGIVYVKDLNRRLFTSYHKLQNQTEKLQSNNSKLLLEHSTLASQSRVQLFATQRLQMQIPPSTDVVVIKI